MRPAPGRPAYDDAVTIAIPTAPARALDALGPAGRRRAAAAAGSLFASDVSVPSPALDPVPVVLGPEEWEELSAGLVQRARLLDALHADLYGPRTVLGSDVAPAAALLADPAYLRTATSIPSRGGTHLLALGCTVQRAADGGWQVLADHTDVPDGAGLALELRRALSRSAPELYSSTALRRLHPFMDGMRSALHQRSRAEGRAGRAVVLTDSTDPLRAFDHHWFANLLGAPVVSVTDLRTGSGSLSLRLPGADPDPGDGIDALVRLVPSSLLDPLDLGPTPLGGVTGLVEAARCGDVEILNPLGAGILENPALARALPDLCRQLLHEDLLLRPAEDGPSEPGAAPATTAPSTAPSLDPAGGDALVERPVRLQLLVMAGADGFEVMPGGIARTADAAPETLKDVWVAVPPSSSAGADPHDATGAVHAPGADDAPTGLSPYPAMTRSVGSDLFWFGRYLERVDSTARLLRTVLDSTNDLSAETGRAPRTALAVLLEATTDVTTTFPGFHTIDVHDTGAVRDEIRSLLHDTGRPGSLAQSFAALAHTTRGLRDLVSDSVWPSISRMRGRIRALGGADEPLEQGLTDMVDGCLALSGAVADSMPRDLGWDLTETGRRIERTSALLALLKAALGGRRSAAAEARVTAAVVAITESGATYRRTYHAAVQPELLLELLIGDATLPRSLAFQLDRLGAVLDRLPERTPAVELRAPLAALRSRVGAWQPRELLTPRDEEPGSPTGLVAEAGAAMESVRELSTALENRFFRASESTSPWGFDDV
ncbi:circularly permuted type 2 ATP-grasp protein [Brachybacterium horti]